MTHDHISIYSTFPDREAARTAARALVTEGLVACANIMPIDSIYRWEGAVEESPEVAVLLKTRRTFYHRVEARLRELHTYDVPAIVAYPILGGLTAYLDWIADATQGGKAQPGPESLP